MNGNGGKEKVGQRKYERYNRRREGRERGRGCEDVDRRMCTV